MIDTEYKQIRLLALTACVALLMFTSCTANLHYQERAIKQVAIEKGMNATQAACVWSNSSIWSNSSNSNCTITAAQGK